MKTLNCIVVDDDELSRLVVKQCINRIDFLELTAEFESAVEASKAIRDLQVDLIFLDVEMPEMSGLDFIQNQTCLNYVKQRNEASSQVEKKFLTWVSKVDPEMAELLNSMLEFNPLHRKSASELLRHTYFDDVRIS